MWIQDKKTYFLWVSVPQEGGPDNQGLGRIFHMCRTLGAMTMSMYSMWEEKCSKVRIYRDTWEVRNSFVAWLRC